MRKWVLILGSVLVFFGGCLSANAGGLLGGGFVAIGFVLLSVGHWAWIRSRPRWALWSLGGSAAVVVLTTLLVGYSVEQDKLRVLEQKREQEALRAAEQKKAEAKRRAEALTKALAALPSWKEQVAAAWDPLMGRARRDVDEAAAQLRTVSAELNGYSKTIPPGVHEGVDALRADLQNKSAVVEAVIKSRERLAEVKQLGAEARRALRRREGGAAVQACDTGLAHLASAEPLFGTWGEKYLGRSPTAIKREEAKLRSLRKRAAAVIERQEAAARKKAEREAAAARKEAEREAALLAKCGEAPQVSGWDGELLGLEAHLGRFAHDPDSIDVENCTKPLLYEKRCWVSTCDVRGTNAFGGKVLNRMTFGYIRGSFVKL